MVLLIETYEQQYAVLSADITSKIGKLSTAVGVERKTLITELDRDIEEANELLEQMDLEVHEMKHSEQPRLKTRMVSYRVELGRLAQEFKRARNTIPAQDGFHDRVELYGESINLNEEQKQRLLDNTEKLERTGRQLDAGYQILLETEEIGSQVLRDLASQRESIQKSRSRLRDTDAELGRSSRIISGMIARSLQHRFLLLSIAVVFCIVVVLGFYISASRDR